MCKIVSRLRLEKEEAGFLIVNTSIVYDWSVAGGWLVSMLLLKVNLGMVMYTSCFIY